MQISQSNVAKTKERKSTGISPGRFNEDAGEVGTLSVGGATVVFVPVEGVYDVGVDLTNVSPVEFVEFPDDSTSPERAPKYASFRVTLPSNIVPSPVPGNVDGIQEY